MASSYENEQERILRLLQDVGSHVESLPDDDEGEDESDHVEAVLENYDTEPEGGTCSILRNFHSLGLHPTFFHFKNAVTLKYLLTSTRFLTSTLDFITKTYSTNLTSSRFFTSLLDMLNRQVR